mgnify:CR=1 FL=1
MRRISIQGSKFSGLDLQPDSTAIDVVIANAAVVSRAFYTGDYDPKAKRLPTCWSSDTQRPAPEVPPEQRQSARCIDCYHNVRGSGSGGGRSCRFSQRLAIVEEQALDTVYQLQVPASSIFGKAGGRSSMPLQAYAKFLSGHGTPSLAVVTRISFDEGSPVPKLFFYPQRPLEEDELEKVRFMVDHDDTLEAIAFSVDQRASKGSPFAEVEGFNINSLG